MTSVVVSTPLRSIAFWRRMLLLAVVVGMAFFAPWRVEKNSRYGTTMFEDSGEVFYPAHSSTYLTFAPIFKARTWQDGSFAYQGTLDRTLLAIEAGVLVILLLLLVAGRYEW